MESPIRARLDEQQMRDLFRVEQPTLIVSNAIFLKLLEQTKAIAHDKSRIIVRLVEDRYMPDDKAIFLYGSVIDVITLKEFAR